MCKYVLLFLLILLVALMAVAAVVVQEYGWVGFLILLGALVLVGYLARKVMPYFFLRLLTRPLRRLGAALRGARIVVHAVEPCAPPDEFDPDSRDDPEAVEDDEYPDAEEDGDTGPPGPFDWYAIEFTVVPPGDESSEGRIVVRQAWSPPYVGAAGPRSPLRTSNPFRGWPPPDQLTGDVVNTPPEVWTGSEYEASERPVYGEQRLRMRVGVTRAVRSVTITYAQFTDLGVVELPRIDVSPGGDE